MELIRIFSGLSKNDAAIAGGKGASLGEMTQAGIPVPPGFVVLSVAFERFLEETDLNVEINAILHTVRTDEMHTVEHASEKIQALILAAKMPTDIATEAEASFASLGAEYVAVRSSATAEDSASAAWAGQLDSFLNTDKDSLLKNVQRCWASLFTPRAIFYRFEKGLDTQKISVAVVVQKMIASEVSGIAFSVHPVTQDHNQLIIEAGYGLGEAIVSGQITPDSYVVTKSPHSILDKNVAEQPRGLVRSAAGGNEWVDYMSEKGKLQKLSDAQILELSEIVLRIENHYGFPCDIEWAFEGGVFYIVQSRPITTLTSKDTTHTSETHRQLLQMGLFERDIFYEQGRWIQAPFIFTFYPHWRFDPVVDRIMPGFKFGVSFTIEGYAFLTKSDGEVIKGFIQQRYRAGMLASITALLDEEGARAQSLVHGYLTKDDQYLRQHLKAFISAYKHFTAFWCTAVYIGDQMTHVARDIGYVSTDAELFAKVHPHLRKTWIENEVAHMADIAREYIAEPNESRLSERLSKYREEYKWIRIAKWLGTPIDEAYARQRLAEETKNCKENNYIESRHSGEAFDDVVGLSVATAYWRAECGRVEMETALRMRSVLEHLGAELGLTYEQVLLLTPDEVAKISQDRTAVDLSKVLKRNSGFFSTVTDGDVEIVLHSEQAEYAKLKETHLHFDTTQTYTELHGVGASPGLVKGKVRLVLSMQNADTFVDGEILVAPETTPSFVPLMRKASAILTGKGGITSHAAIVSRELKKPCIIAIKDVTRILKDGDMVEVDADNGVVRILSV